MKAKESRPTRPTRRTTAIGGSTPYADGGRALHRLAEALDQAGIPEAPFLESAALAVMQLRRPRVSAIDPARQFSDAEREALASGGFDLRQPGAAESDAAVSSAARFAALLADSAGVPEVAKRLGVTPARIRQRAAERSLYAIRLGGTWRFPRWQFDPDGRPMRGLPSVIAALPADLHPLAAWRFLTEPTPDLELLDEAASPLAWLRSGGSPERVAEIARNL